MTTKSISVKEKTKYDEVPYRSKPFPQTHPSSLKAVCSLFGLTTPSPKRANILEIGCSFGGNIIPLAQTYPKANILGLDLSAKQIAVGQQAIEFMGLENIVLQVQDIASYKVPSKCFDYIICHGVYSWVPEPVRKAILSVIAKGLRDDGVAIVSYNTYPGWKINEVYRDAMIYRSQFVENLNEKVSYGFGMLDFFMENLPKNSPWGIAIEQRYHQIRNAEPYYIAHEYLEPINEPCYFHEFMRLAEENDLSFVAEADFQNHFLPIVPMTKEAQDALQREANGDVIRLEQLKDYLSNRTLRQTILTHRSNIDTIDYSGMIQWDILAELHIYGSFKKIEEKASAETFWQPVTQQYIKYKDSPLMNFVIGHLAAASGQTVAVSKLWTLWQKEQDHVDKSVFFDLIAELILNRSVFLHAHAVVWDKFDIEKPKLRDSDRLLSQWLVDHPDTISLTNLFNEALQFDVIMQELMPLLDGCHDHQFLREKLAEAVTEKRIRFYDEKDVEITEPSVIKSVINDHLEYMLNFLGYQGLLIGEDEISE